MIKIFYQGFPKIDGFNFKTISNFEKRKMMNFFSSGFPKIKDSNL